MSMRTSARLFSVAILSLGLITGCATTDEEDSAASGSSAAEQAIADAKALTAEAKAANFEWRDTGKIIGKAEKALAAGDEAGALKLANQALAQSRSAISQSEHENKKYLDNMAVSYAGSDASSSSSSSHYGAGGGTDTYSVERGDNLWSISGKDNVYNDPYQWPLIYKANRDQIKDADLIYPGQALDIDRGASSSDINAAVSHARGRGAWAIGVVEDADKGYLAR